MTSKWEEDSKLFEEWLRDFGLKIAAWSVVSVPAVEDWAGPLATSGSVGNCTAWRVTSFWRHGEFDWWWGPLPDSVEESSVYPD